MEFHGTRSKPISLTQAVPWNSMELWVRQFRWLEHFHGIPWNSMELRVRQFRWHEQFHGIPWNSMELEVRQFRWHEKFHGIPWNSLELGVRQYQFKLLIYCTCKLSLIQHTKYLQHSEITIPDNTIPNSEIVTHLTENTKCITLVSSLTNPTFITLNTQRNE